MSHPGEHPEEESIFHTPEGRPDQPDLPPSIHHSSGSKTVGHWPGTVDGMPRLGATFINLSQGGPTNVIVKLSSTFINIGTISDMKNYILWAATIVRLCRQLLRYINAD